MASSLINAGRLDKRVTLQSRVEGRDATGGVADTYADLATVWGAIEPARAYRTFGSAQEQENHDTLIRIRYLQGVRATSRVLWTTYEGDVKTYEVIGVRLENEHRGSYMYLQCIERQADGWRRG